MSEAPKSSPKNNPKTIQNEAPKTLDVNQYTKNDDARRALIKMQSMLNLKDMCELTDDKKIMNRLKRVDGAELQDSGMGRNEVDIHEGKGRPPEDPNEGRRKVEIK